jgi:hypothetical protein
VAQIWTNLLHQVLAVRALATLEVAEKCAPVDREAIIVGMVRPLPRSSNTHLQVMLGPLAPLPPTCPEAVDLDNWVARFKVQAIAETIRADLSHLTNNIQVLTMEVVNPTVLLKEVPQTSNLLFPLLPPILLSRPRPPKTGALLPHLQPTSRIR